MRKSLIVLGILCSQQITFSQSISKTMLRLPDTGETTSYTSTFGEDNDYNINAPFFINNGDGTVTDTITGLMWQKTDGGEMTIENATTYCNTLTLAGYTDWRLPTAHEGFSILNQQYANPSLDATVFTTTNADYWWTSTRQANDTTKIWVTNAGGGIGNHPKAETVSAGGVKQFHVRAVREINTPTVVTHFTDNGNGTITDNVTGLIWQKTPYVDSLTWENSLTYADTLTFNGFTDWRLPNIKELQSINDESLINPSVNTTYFPTISKSKFYWSSTTLPNQTTKAWYLYPAFGITTYDYKTVAHHLICVRGNQASTTSIKSISKPTSSLNVFPNPFTSSIKLSMKNQDIEFFNAMGQLIYAGNNIECQDFSSLPSGIYFIKTYTSYNKIIKE